MDWKTCFQGKKILVVEDDSINRDLMNDILTQMQCQVTFAEDGNVAIAKVSQEKFDLVFMDIRMPNKDGLQATREIRALGGENQATPIIALTASVQEDRNTILQSGMTDMISKPLNLEELRDKMGKYC